MNSGSDQINWSVSRKIISIIAALALVISMTPSVGTTSAVAKQGTAATLADAATYSGGTGTQEDPYQIAAAADMKALSDAVAGGDACTGVYFEMTADVDLSIINEVSWTPIGSESLAFAGNFDGAEFAINGLNVNTDKGYVGLFGNVSGVVQNLTVNGTVTSTGSNLDCAAGIVAKLSAGGIVTNCVNNANVTASAMFKVGGVVGMVGEPEQLVSETNEMATVSQCINNGEVNGLKKNGGVAGYNAGTIEGCANFGKVIGNNGASKGGTGGICGYNGCNNVANDGGIINNCYNFGYINSAGAGEASKWTGGLVGFQNAKSTLANSYNAGLVNFSSTRIYPLIGQNEGTATDCLWLNEDTGDTTSNYVASDGLGTDAKSTNCLGKTSDELKAAESVTFLNTVSSTSEVGNAWVAGAEDGVSKGFPMLAWQKEFTVSFDGVKVAPQKVRYGNHATQPEDPAIEGYTFDGWFTDNTYTTAFDFTSPITADTTVYAKMSVATYTVNFEMGAAPEVEAQKVEYGKLATKPADPSVTGYTFDGWFADAEYKTAFNFNTKIKVDTTVYAKVTPITQATADFTGSAIVYDSTLGIALKVKMTNTKEKPYEGVKVEIGKDGRLTLTLPQPELTSAGLASEEDSEQAELTSTRKMMVIVEDADSKGSKRVADKMILLNRSTGRNLTWGTTNANGVFSYEMEVDDIPIYRLYNPYSGEHLFTMDKNEYDELGNRGWHCEDVSWTSPDEYGSSTPVYRLYNKYNSEHLYTVSEEEYNDLKKIGWTQEGIAWYSDDDKGTAVYRLFNPWEEVGTHHYTTSKVEYDYLWDQGWEQEGTAWYGLK